MPWEEGGKPLSSINSFRFFYRTEQTIERNITTMEWNGMRHKRRRKLSKKESFDVFLMFGAPQNLFWGSSRVSASSIHYKESRAKYRPIVRNAHHQTHIATRLQIQIQTQTQIQKYTKFANCVQFISSSHYNYWFKNKVFEGNRRPASHCPRSEIKYQPKKDK